MSWNPLHPRFRRRAAQYRTYRVGCNGERASIPLAHVQLRKCAVTGQPYYTVDADPGDRCTFHSRQPAPKEAA